jgi:GcrA cell cycle regulator
MIQPHAWPETQVEMLHALNDEGLTASQITAKMNQAFGIKRTRNAIIGKMHRLGMKSKSSETGDPKIRAKRFRTSTPKPPKEPKAPRITLARPLPPMGIGPATERAAPLQRVEATPTADMPQVKDGLEKRCKFPIGSVPRGCGDEQRFCGADREAGGVYCQAHRAIAYRPEQPRRRVAA